MIPVPFWKPQGNPNILLWVPFTDGTAKDISIYNRTPTTTLSGAATIIPNFLSIDITSASPTSFLTQISYPIRSLPYGTIIPKTVPLTFEGFVKWHVSPANSGPFDMFHFSPTPTGGSPDIRRYEGFSNAGNVDYGDSSSAIESGPTVTNPLAPAGTLYHWAWVIPASGTNVQQFYINGVQVFTFTQTRTNDYNIAANGEWLIGGTTNTVSSPNHVAVDLGETRVSAANLYPNGTSFTPPTPGHLPPVP